METKKTKKANSATHKSMYFNIGLVVAMALVISAFEWKSYQTPVVTCVFDMPDIFDPVLDAPVTVQEVPKPPKPRPKVERPVIALDDSPELEEYKQEVELPDDVEIEIPPVVGALPDEKPEEPPFHLIVEEMPSYEGGYEAFMKYVSRHVRYPRHSRNMGIEGKVFVEFIIDEAGKITEVKAIKGIGAGCDEEAVRVLAGAPDWNPGKQRHVPVKVKMVLPITFKLGRGR